MSMPSLPLHSRRVRKGCLTGVPVLCLALGLAGGVSADAQAQATVERAEALETAFAGWLARMQERSAGTELALEGEISITPTGSTYTGFLPTSHWIVRTPRETSSITLPTVRFRLNETENGRLEVDATLPEQVVVETFDDPAIADDALTTATPERTVEIRWTPGPARFTIAPEYEAAIAADLAFDDIRITLSDQPATVEIGHVGYVVASEQTGEHAFDTVTDISAETITVSDEEATLSLDALGIVIELGDARFDLFTAWNQHLTELQAGIESGALDAEEITAQTQALLDTEAPLFSAIGGTLALTGLRLEGGGEGLSLDQLSVGSRLGDLDAAAARYDFELGLEALTITPRPEIEGLVPDRIRLDLTVSDLPGERIGALFADFLSSFGGPPGAQDFAAMTFGIGLYSALSESTATLSVDEMAYVSDLLSLDFAGTVTPDITAALGVVVDAEFGAAKLPQLINALSALGGPGAQIAAALTVLQGLGAVEETADGTIRRYHLEVLPDGTVLLNDNDLGPILNAL
ncbi:MAG: hypothetical protein RLO50_20200 [Azospirillaceae bacterium]